MKKTLRVKPIKLITGLAALSLIGINTGVFAGAYQLNREYNAVEIGNSGSGGAAIATDASTSYANPAGLVRIPNKLKTKKTNFINLHE